jgi:hypothetical protein
MGAKFYQEARAACTIGALRAQVLAPKQLVSGCTSDLQMRQRRSPSRPRRQS